jgi:hypothetical protein
MPIRTRDVSPLGALLRGALAGAAGAAAQNAFFRITARVTPATPKDVFEPPERIQREESELETVARRFVEDFMQRGPLTAEQKARAGAMLHYAFGVRWGGLYGLLAESAPRFATPAGALAFGAIVWMVSDNGVLPLLRVAAPFWKYPPRVHAYAIAAHAAYALGLYGTYEVLRGPLETGVAGLIAAIGARRAAAHARAEIAERIERPGAARRLARAIRGVALHR